MKQNEYTSLDECGAVHKLDCAPDTEFGTQTRCTGNDVTGSFIRYQTSVSFTAAKAKTQNWF